jgi:hypothetical protein
VSFQINSSRRRVTGTKSFVPDAPLAATPCQRFGAGSFGLLQYGATIVSPEGRFTDRGVADTFVFETALPATLLVAVAHLRGPPAGL